MDCAIRIGIAALISGMMLQFGGSFDNGSDSGKYINIAKDFLVGGWGNQSAEQLQLMPLYPAFLAIDFSSAGMDNLRAVVPFRPSSMHSA